MAEQNGSNGNGGEFTPTLPSWVAQFKERWSSEMAHAYILHFNVRDSFMPAVTFNDLLARVLGSALTAGGQRPVIAFYSRRGFSFLTPEMELEFKTLVRDPEKLARTSGALADQVRNMSAGIQLPAEPSAALPVIDKALRQNARRVAVVVENADLVWPAADVAMMPPEERTNLDLAMRWGNDGEIMTSGNILVLTAVSRSGLHRGILEASARYESILVDLPNEQEREWFIQVMVERMSGGSETPPFDLEIDLERFARMTAGLSKVGLEDIMLRAKFEGALTARLVKERKTELMLATYGEVLEPMDPKAGWEIIGGLEHIKNGFIRNVIRPISTGNLSRVPKGVLMMGPPGTGKTLIAEVVAKECGFNAVFFNIAKILGKYVGESERNLEMVLTAIRSLAPVVVFMDEIDQGFRRGESGDSGVSNNIFGRLLNFMSDPSLRGRVIFLAATNRPELIDGALKRPGRFDVKAPFLAPGPVEQAEIIKIQCRRFGVALEDGDDLGPVLADISGWTGAEIEGLVRKALSICEDEGLCGIDALQVATGRLLPSTVDIAGYEAKALAETNDLDWVPVDRREAMIAAAKGTAGPDQDQGDDGGDEFSFDNISTGAVRGGRK